MRLLVCSGTSPSPQLLVWWYLLGREGHHHPGYKEKQFSTFYESYDALLEEALSIGMVLGVLRAHDDGSIEININILCK